MLRQASTALRRRFQTMAGTRSLLSLLAAVIRGSFMNAIRSSSIVAVVIIIGVLTLVTNWSSVVYGVINIPSYMGSYERRGGIRYGELQRQSLDVYLPRVRTNSPIVIFWYGGAWRRGSKEEYRFVGAALAGAGYIAILPDYRLFPQARFAQFVDDGALAVKWVHEHAAELGGDPRSIFLMGHSSGGHLAATLALDEQHLRKIGGDSNWVRGWIALSTPYELKWLLPGMPSIFRGHAAAEWRPIEMVSGRAPPGLLIHGLEDDLIHPYEAVDMDRKLRAAGVPVKCRIYENAGHNETVLNLVLPVRAQTGTLTDVREFIDRTVDGTPKADFSAPCPDVDGRKDWKWPHPPPRAFLPEIP